jgi:hypothetical protein
VDYLENLDVLRRVWILEPGVFTEELYDATFIKPTSSDDWPDVVRFLKENAPHHQKHVFAGNCCIFLDFHWDGVQLFKSGVQQCVPLLVRISAIVNDKGQTFVFSRPVVFMVGMFMGHEKPNPDDLLKECLEELLSRHPGRNPAFAHLNSPTPKTFKRFAKYMTSWDPMLSSQFLPPTTFTSISIGLDRLIGDAPARKDFTGTIGHTGYFATPRCIQEGVRNDALGFVAFRLVKCKDVLRQDADFDVYKEHRHWDKKVRIWKLAYKCLFPKKNVFLLQNCRNVVTLSRKQ